MIARLIGIIGSTQGVRFSGQAADEDEQQDRERSAALRTSRVP